MSDPTAARDRSWPCLLSALVLVPWLDKAFHIDDTQFLIHARLITDHPFAPYTQVFEWDSMRVALIDFPHPLLWQYALAALGSVFGESEVALHGLTFGCGLLALWSLRGLAGRLGVPALPACVLLAGSSAFVVMGSTIMPDLAATALLLASFDRGIEAVERGRRSDALVAGLLAAGAFLTRFTAAVGIGLLLAYPLLRRRRDRAAYAPFAIAAAVALLSETVSFVQTGRPHFVSSLLRWSADASLQRDLRFAFDEVTFLGAQLPLTGLVWLAAFARGAPGAFAVAAAGAVAFGLAAWLPDGSERMLAAALFAWPGLTIVFDAAGRLGSAARSGLRPPDSRSAVRWLAAAMVVATTFATVRYEHVAVKYLLLPLPFAILLLLDGLSGWLHHRGVRAFLWASCAVGVATGLGVALSDYRWANSYRDFVSGPLAERPRPDGTLFYNAQWGLRYYAERAGLSPYRGGALGPDDELLVSEIVPPNWRVGRPAGVAARFDLSYPGPFALLSLEHRAGFYSNYWGGYPFVWAPVVRDRIWILRAARTPPSARPSPRPAPRSTRARRSRRSPR